MDTEEVTEAPVTTPENDAPVADPQVETEPVEPVQDIKIEIQDFKDPTPDDPIDKQDVLIFYEQQKIKLLEDQHKEQAESISNLGTKLDDLIKQGASGDSSLGDVNQQIITKLDTLIEHGEYQKIGSSTLVTYGTVFIPLIIICVLLWRFFATFLRSAR